MQPRQLPGQQCLNAANTMATAYSVYLCTVFRQLNALLSSLLEVQLEVQLQIQQNGGWMQTMCHTASNACSSRISSPRDSKSSGTHRKHARYASFEAGDLCTPSLVRHDAGCAEVLDVLSSVRHHETSIAICIYGTATVVS